MNSSTSQDLQSRTSCRLAFLIAGPTAVRAILPSTSRFMHVFPGKFPAPMRKLMCFRSMTNAGDVSVPVERSPSR